MVYILSLLQSYDILQFGTKQIRLKNVYIKGSPRDIICQHDLTKCQSRTPTYSSGFLWHDTCLLFDRIENQINIS